MSNYRWVILGVVTGVVVLAGFLVFNGRRESVSIDLISVAPNYKRAVLPMDQAFVIMSATVDGVMKPSIFTQPESRFIWRQVIPENAWLRVSLALRQDAWTKPGDGVLFRVAISVGAKYDAVANVVINPYGNAADRHWHDLAIDLGAYAGEEANIILATNAGVDEKSDRNNDLALWGAPRIVIR
jgi:hypothetical protein